jgi:GNAT superfamily N-acetyltransferase
MKRSAQPSSIAIIPYTSVHLPYFKALNEQWINMWFTLEEKDKRMLDDPQGYVLDGGGYIFIALYNEEVVGTCALLKIDELTFELAKMAVAPTFRGKGIGYALGLHCVDFAKRTAIRKIELLSNTVLTPAITLYKKLGFVEVALPTTDYKRANIKMELDLQALMKISVVVTDDLPGGLAINAAALVTATLGHHLKHLIGNKVKDGSGSEHPGLTWLPVAILKADKTTLQTLRSKATDRDLLVIDVPEPAQRTRTYEDFTKLMLARETDNLFYLAVGLYGDKTKVVELTKNLALYK